MSSSKFDLGGSSLLSPQKSQSDLGSSLISPTKTNSSSLGLNLVASKSNSMGMTNQLIDSSASSTNALQIGDLLPNQSSNALDSLASPSLVEQTTNNVSLEAADALQIIHLNAVGSGKVAVVKAIRVHWNTGLKRAKELADSAPADLPGLPEAKAQAALMELSNLGAVVRMRKASN